MSEPERGGLLRRLRRALTGFDPAQLGVAAGHAREAARAAGIAAKEVERLQRLSLREHDASHVLNERVTMHLDRLTRENGAAIESLHRTLEQQTGVVGRLVQRVERAEELEVLHARVLARVDRIGRSAKPVLIGPWTGEVGFEVLYWVPFVRWAVERAGLDPSRVTLVSRGGTASWYGPIAGRYVDVFDHISPGDLRAASVDRPKQRGVSGLDRRLMRALQRSGLRGMQLLHPSLMYDVFYPVWKQHATVARILEHARYAPPLPPPALPESIERALPPRFTAVRFYYSQCFPDTPTNRKMAREVVTSLARRSPVVLLNPGVRADDHADWEPPEGLPIQRFTGDMPPSRNLEIQTAILARASGFVGTYGGFAYLAPWHGVPSLAFYSEPTFYIHHLELVNALLTQPGCGRLCLIDTSTAGLAAAALAGLA